MTNYNNNSKREKKTVHAKFQNILTTDKQRNFLEIIVLEVLRSATQISCYIMLPLE